jgi:hypothetical protein
MAASPPPDKKRGPPNASGAYPAGGTGLKPKELEIVESECDSEPVESLLPFGKQPWNLMEMNGNLMNLLFHGDHETP